MFERVLFSICYELFPSKIVDGPARMWHLHPWRYQTPWAQTGQPALALPALTRGWRRPTPEVTASLGSSVILGLHPTVLNNIWRTLLPGT